MLGTLHQAADGQFAIRFVRQVAQSPDYVWPFITTPDGLISWLFPAPIDLSGPAGTEVTFVFPDDRAPTQSGQIIASTHPTLLEFTWGEETLRWDLTPIPQGYTELVFTNLFLNRDLPLPSPPAGMPPSMSWKPASPTKLSTGMPGPAPNPSLLPTPMHSAVELATPATTSL